MPHNGSTPSRRDGPEDDHEDSHDEVSVEESEEELDELNNHEDEDYDDIPEDPTLSVLKIHFFSYGVSNGPPDPRPDLTFNARKLPHPDNISTRTGLNKDLSKEFFALDGVEGFYMDCKGKTEGLLRLLVESDSGAGSQTAFDASERRVVEARVAVCCVAGVHRSVAITERLGRREDWHNIIFGHGDRNSSGWIVRVAVSHRDIGLWKKSFRKRVDKGQQRQKQRAAKMSRGGWDD